MRASIRGKARSFARRRVASQSHADVERNLALYPWYQAARNLLFWLPVFFLYLSGAGGAEVSVADAFVLEAIYYATVVVLEVPSGYLSDRLGRRPTLVLASACWVAACLVFASTSTFAAFALAQGLLAAGMALNSGTDGSLLYDTLSALGRTDEFAVREGRAQALGRLALGMAALAGGALGAVDLRLAYAASAASAVLATTIALAFVEPTGRAPAAPAMDQLRAVLSRLRHPVLRWTFAYAVAMTVFAHVPYELAQPYVHAVLEEVGRVDLTEPVSGLLTAIAMVIAAIVSARAGWLARRGLAGVLLAALAIQLVVIVTMGAWLHPAVLAVVALRGVAGAIEGPLVQAAAHPLLSSDLRATYLSVQSLGGRLAFAASLAIASAGVGGSRGFAPAALASVALGFAAALVVTGLLLAATARALTRREELGKDFRIR
jgi:predicted MFS family arabinose efflux permease